MFDDYVRHGDPNLVDTVLRLPVYVRTHIKMVLTDKRTTADGITSCEFRLLRAISISLTKINK